MYVTAGDEAPRYVTENLTLWDAGNFFRSEVRALRVVRGFRGFGRAECSQVWDVMRRYAACDDGFGQRIGAGCHKLAAQPPLQVPDEQ